MKSIRLNKSIRTEIVENIMESYSTENVRPTEPKDSMKDLDKAVHDWLLETHKKDIAMANRLHAKHSSLIKKCYAFRYKDHTNSVRSVYFSTCGTSCSDSKGNWVDSVYYPDLWSGCVIDLHSTDTDTPEELQQVVNSIKGSKKAVRLERKAVSDYDNELLKYKQDVTQVVDGCNTSGQLIKVWEEIEQFLPNGVADPSDINLPTVNVNVLNRKLGLNNK